MKILERRWGKGMVFEIPFKNRLNVWHYFSQDAEVTRIFLICWVYQNFLARCRLLLRVEGFKSYYLPPSSAFSLPCSWSDFYFHCTYEHVPTNSVTDETVPCGTHFQSKCDYLMNKKAQKEFWQFCWIHCYYNLYKQKSLSQLFVPLSLAYISCCFKSEHGFSASWASPALMRMFQTRSNSCSKNSLNIPMVTPVG